MPITRIPFSQPIEARNASFVKDSRSTNCYFEQRDQKREMVKRPGLTFANQVAYSPSPTAVWQAQGMAEFNDKLVMAINNVVYVVDPATGYSKVLAGYLSQWPSLVNLPHVYMVKDFLNKHLFIHDGTAGYVLDADNTWTVLTNDTVTSLQVAGGANYSTGATMTVAPPPGIGTTATGTLTFSGSAGGSISDATVVIGGSGYTTAPACTVNPAAPVSTGSSSGSAGSTQITVPTAAGLYTGMYVYGNGLNVGSGSLTTTFNGSTGNNQITVSSASGITVGQFVVGNGIPWQSKVMGISGTTITLSQSLTSNQSGATVHFDPYAMLAFITNINGTTLTLSIPNNGSVFGSLTFYDVGTGATITAVLNAFPTAPYVAGNVFLDQYMFIGTSNNRIYSSDLANPKIWQALDYISYEQSTDKLIALSKHQNYLVGMGEWSTQFFYDSGQTLPGQGSPLSVASSYMSEVGCASGPSVVQTEQTVLWIGQSKATGRSVFMMDGTSATRVSTAYIDHFLDASDLAYVTAYAIKVNGHLLYLLTLHDLDVTIVYDAMEKVWYQWTMYAQASNDEIDRETFKENYFRPSYYAKINGTIYVLDDDRGTLYTLNENQYTDNGAPIYYRTVTDIIDSGTTKRKFYSRAEVIGDKIPATMRIRHTEDDYKTWSNYRSVSLNAQRPVIYALGTARRRAWEFLCTDDAPLRLDAVEVDFSIGELENEGIAQTNYRR